MEKQNKISNQHLHKQKPVLKKINVNKVIFNATKKYTNRMMRLIRDRIITNTKMPDYNFKKLKYYLQRDLAKLVADLVYQDVEELYSAYESNAVKKLPAYNPKKKQLTNPRESNADIPESSLLAIQKAERTFRTRLDYRIRNVFSVPFLIIMLANRDQSKAISIATSEIRELIAEVNRLMNYEEIIKRPNTRRDQFVRDILVAIDELKEKPVQGKKKNKITITAIAKQMNYKGRASFYDDCGKHRIDLDKDLNIVDRKTKKTFMFSQQ